MIIKLKFSAIFLTLFFISCSPLKNDGMTDADYIKINVRYGTELITSEHTGPIITNPFNDDVMSNELKKGEKLNEEICKKYGYTVKALGKKYNEVHTNRDSYWIINNIHKLRMAAWQNDYNGQITFPDSTLKIRTDEEWEEFFEKNKSYLKASKVSIENIVLNETLITGVVKGIPENIRSNYRVIAYVQYEFGRLYIHPYHIAYSEIKPDNSWAIPNQKRIPEPSLLYVFVVTKNFSIPFDANFNDLETALTYTSIPFDTSEN